MADETEEKTKQTVPAMERTAKGVAAHASAVQDRQWDKERKVFRDPVLATLALFTYAKLTPALLAEAEERTAKKIHALENRIAEFETRLTSLERWKAEAEAQTALMVKGAEEMLASGNMPAILEQLRTGALGVLTAPTEAEVGNVVVLPPTPPTAAPAVDSTTVTSLKQPKKKATDDNKNGGVA